MGTYTLGQAVKLSFTIKDASGTLVDPGTLSLTILRPSGIEDGPFTTLVHDSLGTFHYIYEPTAIAVNAGTYRARLATTGPDSAIEGSFYFAPSPFV